MAGHLAPFIMSSVSVAALFEKSCFSTCLQTQRGAERTMEGCVEGCSGGPSLDSAWLLFRPTQL